MGWEEIPWYTLTDSFDVDFGVHEWHGHNAFLRDGERVFRTYFINLRGDEAMGTTWSYLDMTFGQRNMERAAQGWPYASGGWRLPAIRIPRYGRRDQRTATSTKQESAHA